MTAPALEGLVSDVRRLLGAGATLAGADEALRRRAAALRELAPSVPALGRLADAAEAAVTAPPGQAARALLDLALLLRPVRDSLAGARTGLSGEVTPAADTRDWATPLPSPEALELRDELARRPRPGCVSLTRAVLRDGALDLRLVGPAVKAALAVYANRGLALPDWLHTVAPELEALGPEAAVGTGERPGLLPRLGGEAALRACRAALTSDDPAVRGHGANWLAQLAPPGEALNQLLPLLADPERAVWAPAAFGLSGLGPAAVPALVGRLREPAFGRGASMALDQMTQHGKDRAVIEALAPHLPALLDALPAADPEALANLLRVVYALRPEPADVSPRLVALLDHFRSPSEEDGGRRERLAWALGAIGISSEADLDRLAAVARDDPSPGARDTAAYSLGRLAPAWPRALFLLLDCFGDRREHECPAARAVGYLGRKARPALPRLIGMVEGGDTDRRLSALQALWGLATAGLEAAPAVVRAAREGQAEVRAEALKVVSRFGPALPEYPDVVRAALRDDEPAVRDAGRGMIRAIRTKSPDVVPLLLELAKDKDVWVRTTALDQLKGFAVREPEALAALAAALGDEEATMRSAAARALAGVRPKSEVTVPPLVKALQSADPSVRETAARALGWLGPLARPAVPALTRALGDKEGWVKSAVELALKRIQEGKGNGP